MKQSCTLHFSWGANIDAKNETGAIFPFDVVCLGSPAVISL